MNFSKILNLQKRVERFFSKIIHLNKRIFILALVLLVVVAMLAKMPRASGAVSPLPDYINQAYFNAQNKITGDSRWQPHGWGSGEYINTLPTIKSGAVLDFGSGDVIWSMNLDQKTASASLSKLATVMTALDIAPLDTKIYVSGKAAVQIPTNLGLESGEHLTLREAVSAAIMTSANDATEAIADSLGQSLGGDDNKFMELVNLKLQKIGALNSHFVTATGLDDPNHYTTVHDLAIIAHWAKENYPEISVDAGQKYLRLNPSPDHRLIDLPNWNALLGTYPGVDGLKIGYTGAAGYSTIVTANRDGHELMAIIIGAASIEDREKAAATLLNYGFEKYGIDSYPVSSINLTSRFNDWKEELSSN